MRLQKALAEAGVASRRHAEALIAAGRVKVNGAVVRAMGVTIDPQRDRLEVDGRAVRAAGERTYIMLHKPRNVVTTASDPAGRATIMDFVPRDRRLFPVGRLDRNSEGLVLLTDDGALAHRLMHPRYEHEKEYRVLVEGRLPSQAIQKLREGIELEEGRTAPARVEFVEHVAGDTWLRIVLREGRKRQIRRMMEAVGHRVKRLVRVRLGPLRLGDLPVGQARPLTPREIAELKRAS